MPLHPDVEMVVQFFLDRGDFTVDDCTRLARVIRSFQSLSHAAANPLELPTGAVWKRGMQGATPGKARGPAKTRRGRRRKYTPAKHELVRLYLDEGLSAKEIAARHGVSAATVNSRLRAYGISRKPRGSGGNPENGTSTSGGQKASREREEGSSRSWAVDPQELKALRESYSVGQLAELYGVSVATVTARLREFGLAGKGRPVEKSEEAKVAAWKRLWGEAGEKAEEKKKEGGMAL